MSEISSIYFGKKAVQSIETKNGVLFGGGDPFEYEAVDGGYAVTGFKDSLLRKGTYPRDFSIPEEHNDSPVVEIGESAFYNCSINTVNIPKSVKRVKREAFAWCNATINLDEECEFEFIGNSCLSGCYGVSILTVNGIIEGSLRDFRDLTRVDGDYSFQGDLNLSNDSKLTSINLESVTSIDNSGMQNVGLQEVNIPNCTYIGSDAFRYNVVVKTLYLSTSAIRFGDSYCFSRTAIEEVHCKASDISRIEKSYFKRVYLIGNETEIAPYTFSSCNKLESLVINNGCLILGNSMCSGCSALTQVVIPNSVTTIGQSVFLACSSLTNIMIPDSVTAIGGGSFVNCSKLEDIVLPSGLTSIESRMFEGCSKLEDVVIPNGVTSIGSNAFTNCSSITELVLPESVVSVDKSALSGCEGLIKISSPNYDNQLEAITAHATNLQELYLTSGTEITATYFGRLKSLKKVVLAPSIVSIGNSTFNNCTSLSDFTFENVQTIGNYAFENTGFAKIENLNSLTMLGENAFYRCSNLTSVDLSDSVSLITLKGSVFRDCLNLNTVYLPNGLERIEGGVFWGCTRLLELSLPSSLTYLGANCFRGDYNLHKVIINSPSIEMDTKCFYSSSPFLEVYNLSSTVIDSSYDYTLTDPFNEYGGRLNPICPIIVHSSLEEPSSVEYFGNYIIGSVDGVACYLLGVKDKDLTPSDCVLPESIEFRGVTINSYEIGDFAFYKNEKLISVSIPRSVPKIRQFAFTNSQNLETVSLGGDLELDQGGFANTKISQIDFAKITSFGQYSFMLTKITEAILKEGVTNIPSQAFTNSKLRTITLPTTLETIYGTQSQTYRSNNPFYGCTHLVEIINKSSLILHIGGYPNEGLIGQYAIVIRTTSFESTITNDANYYYLIEDNKAYLFDVTSSNAKKIQNVPQNVTFKGNVFEVGVIWAYAFSNVVGWGYKVVETINVSSTVKSLGRYAFSGLSALKVVEGLNNVETVGENAFDGCSSLTTVSLLGVSEISDHCFSNCSVLSTISLPRSLASIGDSAFYRCGLVEFSIPDGVTKIPKWCFGDCEQLLSVNIPQSVTSLGEDAFYNCRLLSEILIPEGVTSISDGCFHGNWSLLSVNVPQSVTHLGNNVFAECSRLSEIIFHEGVGAFGTNLFNSCVALTTVNIPQSVTRFGSMIFYRASALTSTSYNGTIEQFNAITKDFNWSLNSSLTTVHCTDGDITL